MKPRLIIIAATMAAFTYAHAQQPTQKPTQEQPPVTSSAVAFSGISNATAFDPQFRQFAINWMADQVETLTKCKLKSIQALSLNSIKKTKESTGDTRHEEEVWKISYCDHSPDIHVYFDITEKSIKLSAEEIPYSINDPKASDTANATSTSSTSGPAN